MSAKNGLPKYLRSFFWDYPFESLSLVKDRDLIIRRLLSSGSWDAVCWLRRRIGDQELRDWIISHQGRGLTPRQMRFWGLLYDLPAKEVNHWVQVARSGIWGNR